MPAKTAPRYVPGVCNIGPRERAKRRQFGIISLCIAAVLFGVLLFVHASRFWRLILVLPLSGAASGILQDVLHFCAGFGLRGLYNVAHNAGQTSRVEDEGFLTKDRRKARLIILLSLLFALGITLGCLLVPATAKK